MYTSRRLTGSTLAEMLYPPFRKVDFRDTSPVKTVTYHLRYAWRTTPPPPLPTPTSSYDQNSIPNFMRHNQDLTEEERKGEETEDREMETPWRREVYNMYNHVFADVMRFLCEVGPGMGHCHHPCQEPVGVRFEEGRVGKVMKWDRHVLIIPAFLAEGVKIRAMRVVKENSEEEIGKKVDEGGVEKEVEMVEEQKEEVNEEKKESEGVKEGGAVETTDKPEESHEVKEEEEEVDENLFDIFSKDTPWDIWWLKKGTEVKFIVEGDFDEGKEGLAAVLVLGNLCDEDDLPRMADVEEEEEEEEEENNEIEELRVEIDNFKVMAEEERKEAEGLKEEW